MNYDIIGDIHGHADALKALLSDLGYRERDGTWRRPDRQAIFLGDFIDRGPEQVESVETDAAVIVWQGGLRRLQYRQRRQAGGVSLGRRIRA